MKDKLQLSVFFCEDYRVEEGGKPIILGLLPPVGYVDWDEQGDDLLYLFCTVTAPSQITEVNLELTLKISPLGGQPSSKRRQKTLRFQEDFEVGEPWTSWLPLRVKVPTDPLGARLRAELSANKQRAWATFLVKPTAELDEQSRPPKERSPSNAGRPVTTTSPR